MLNFAKNTRFLYGLMVFSLMSCVGSGIQKSGYLTIKDRGCYPAQALLLNDSLLEKNADFLVPADSLAYRRFSASSINLASSLGITDLLNRFSYYDLFHPDTLEYLKVRQTLDERLTLAFLDISTAVAEINCEENRTREASVLLLDAIDKKIQKLNVLSILTGAAGTLASSAAAIAEPDNSILIESFAIAGGAAATYYSLKQLSLKKKIYLDHERNYLKDLIEGPVQSHIFHPNIWYYLNQDTLSLRKKLCKEFKETGIADVYEKDEKVAAILFGKGGPYTINMLEARIEMLALLESEVNKMKYDLKLLQQELVLRR